MTLEELQTLVVDGFPLSTTRSELMAALARVFECLQSAAVDCEVWVDGSFLTQKINPNDSDIVLRVNGVFYDNASEEQRTVIDWVGSNLKKSHRCDSYMFNEWTEGHPLHAVGQEARDYWLRQWGFDRSENGKGMAVVTVGEGF